MGLEGYWPSSQPPVYAVERPWNSLWDQLGPSLARLPYGERPRSSEPVTLAAWPVGVHWRTAMEVTARAPHSSWKCCEWLDVV